LNKFLLPLLFVVHFSSAQSNLYHPFPDSNSVWRETLTATDGSFGINNWEEEKFIDGDTLLAGMIYHKIYETGLFSHCTIPCFTPDTINYYYHNFVGTIRADANKMIYMYDWSHQRDTVLYDFNLNIGDTIHDSYLHQHDSAYPVTVLSIDSIFDGINFRKRFNLSGPGNALVENVLIEGIGTTSGLFVPLSAHTFEMGGTLHCFIQNDTIRYTDSSASACVLIDAIDDQTKSISAVSIFPNPFHNDASVSINGFIAEKNSTLTIFNSLGEVVWTEIISQFPFNIERGELKDGLYFYTVNTSSGTVGTGKFILY
jgi:hypothetical protein